MLEVAAEAAMAQDTQSVLPLQDDEAKVQRTNSDGPEVNVNAVTESQ